MPGEATKYRRGDAHPKYNGGRMYNAKGYVRVTTGRVSGMKFEHRQVIEQLLLEQKLIEVITAVANGSIPDDPWIQTQSIYNTPGLVERVVAREVMSVVANPPSIPAGMHIHHIDHHRDNNCPCNLMLLDAAIHRAITVAHTKLLRRVERESMMAKLRGEGI